MSQFRAQDFFHKLTHWEYWPLWLLYIPYFIKVSFYAIKSGSYGFMTAVNPGIKNSGFFDDSKVETLNLFPPEYIPQTIFGDSSALISELLFEIDEKNINYPLILKPDIGERGTEVKKVRSEAELIALLSLTDYPFQIQEFIDFKEEIGVFWYRYPEDEQGKVTSLTLKKYLQVEGDGNSTIDELILSTPRSRFQREILRSQRTLEFDKILEKGETLIINDIGNHSRGTTFLNGNSFIDEKLRLAMDTIMKNAEGIFYGRADIKCASLESLKNLKDFKILEFNGVKAEPAHIYDPDYPLLKAQKELLSYVDIIHKIATQNKAKGIPFEKNAFWAFFNYSFNKLD